MTVRREAHRKEGCIIATRVGDPSHPHAVVVALTRHDNHGGRMDLTGLHVGLVEAIPGDVRRLGDRLADLVPKARARAETGLGRHLLLLDVTRQPQSYRLLMERMEPSLLLIVTTHGRLMPSVPYYHVGRITLLSHLATQLSRPGVVAFPDVPGDDPRRWRREQIRDALAAAQARPPREEPDAYVTETTTQDDVALALAAAAMWAEMSAPDPWVPDAVERERFAA